MGILFKLFHKLLHDPGPVWYIRPLLKSFTIARNPDEHQSEPHLTKCVYKLNFSKFVTAALTYRKLHNELK